jgi:hypothetical protein
MIDRRNNDRRTSLTPFHFKYLDQVAELAIEANRSEEEFVADFMPLRREMARQAYREAQLVSRLYSQLIQTERKVAA